LAARVLLGLLAAVFSVGALLALYHAGVEWKLWAGPTGCAGDFVKPASMEDFRQQLKHVRVVRCDEVSFRLFGLSLAGWNVFVSAGLALAAGFGAARKPG
jgi:disulfide bond formation protein DsbB